MANYKDLRYNFAIPSTADVGAMKLIKTLTASSSATLSFVDGTSDVVLDSTYRTYIFKFINMHPATDNVEFTFQVNAAGGSGFNETMTTTCFDSDNSEASGGGGSAYRSGRDQAQGTSSRQDGHSHRPNRKPWHNLGRR